MRGILEEMGTVTHLFQCNDIFGDCVTSGVQCLHHTPGGGGGTSLGLGSLHILSAKGTPANKRRQGVLAPSRPEGICPRMLQKLAR